MLPQGHDTLFLRLRRGLHLREQCRQYHLPLWQCPQMLFVIMGGVTVSAILAVYLAFSANLDPYAVALIAIALTFFLIIQAFIIVHAFERTAEANRMQVEFINITTHQLRSPVTAARWAIGGVMADAEKTLSPAMRENMHIAREAISRIEKLVSSILRLVHLEAGTGMGRAEVFSLRDIVEEVAQGTKKPARTAHPNVRAILPDHPVFVKADAEQVRFVLDHLIDNALQYTGEASDVTVTLTADDREARVEVRDLGAGIPDAEQRHVFERFFRASNARIAAPDGVGLSLYISRRFIQDAGGRMGFASNIGQGSTFWFTLPVVKPTQSISQQRLP